MKSENRNGRKTTGSLKQQKCAFERQTGVNNKAEVEEYLHIQLYSCRDVI